MHDNKLGSRPHRIQKVVIVAEVHVHAHSHQPEKATTSCDRLASAENFNKIYPFMARWLADFIVVICAKYFYKHWLNPPNHAHSMRWRWSESQCQEEEEKKAKTRHGFLALAQRLNTYSRNKCMLELTLEIEIPVHE